MKDIARAALASLACIALGAGAHVSHAQTAAPAEHTDKGGPSRRPCSALPDGAFHKRFNDADKWAKKFDDPERAAWQQPEKVLDALHLDRSARVADIGAGTGYFSARIAERIPEGWLYAADVEPDLAAAARASKSASA